MIQDIIAPVETSLIVDELTPERLLRQTNKGGNEIYIVDGRECAATMREVGRLREITFRMAGGGTGKSCDIDFFDTMTPPCKQLVVWDPREKIILGGYRFIIGKDIKINDDGTPRIATAHMFRFSSTFLTDYLPFTIELGRSFVRTEYQSSRQGYKALFALDNLWDGLGALTVEHPEIRYLFGKMTMYPAYPQQCRNMLLHFLHKHFPDKDCLVEPISPISNTNHDQDLDSVFPNESFDADYRILNAEIRKHGINIPPLINAYMSLSPTMRMFGTAINDEFGNVEESAILLTIAEIYDAKKQRHISSYHPLHKHCK